MIPRHKWSIEVPNAGLEPSDLLRRIPRLLRFRLAGREDRLLLRLARRLGFSEGASIELSPGDPDWRMRAYLGSSPGRWRRHLQLERAGLLGLARHPVARRLDKMMEPSASRLAQALRHHQLTVLPLGCFQDGWRLLLLADGPALGEETLASLRDCARAVVDAARLQKGSGAKGVSRKFPHSSSLGSSGDVKRSGDVEGSRDAESLRDVANGRDLPEAPADRAEFRMRAVRQLADRQQELVANISHDLKNPLAAISTSLQVLDTGRAGELNAAQQRLLGLARRNCDRLLKMVNELVEGSRRDEMETVLQRDELDARLLLHITMADSMELADERHRHLAWVCDHGARVYGDSKQLQRILDNLVGNALKFCETGGHVLVSLRGDQPRIGDEIGDAARALGLSPRGLTMLVEDDGPGFTEEERRRAFDRFWQGEGERTTARGAGLGLSIVHSLVHAHQGFVDLKSGPRVGTKVVVWLPAEAEDARLCGALQTLHRQLQNHVSRGRIPRLILVEAVSAEEEVLAGLSQLCTTLAEDGQRNWTVYRIHPMAAIVLLRGSETPGPLARLMSLKVERSSRSVPLTGGKLESPALRVAEARFSEHGKTLHELLVYARRSAAGGWTAAAAQGAKMWEVHT